MLKHFRLLLAASAAVIAGSLSAGAHGASLTLDDPNCSDFTLTPPASAGGTWKLSCSSISQVPSCTLSASSSKPTINANITLTASCTQAPTSFTWSGCLPTTSDSSTCTTTSSSTGPANYAVTARNATGAGNTATTTVTWVSPGSAPSNCAITPTASSLPSGGGSVTLSASCSGGGAPTNYAWSGGALTQNGPSNQASTNILATTTFSVIASNTGGTAEKASTTVTVASDTGGDGGISCAAAGFANTIPMRLDWSTVGNAAVVTTGFGANTALVVTFTTPANGNARVGNIDYTERGDPQTYRQAVLSSAACGRGEVIGVNEGLSGPIYFTVGTQVPGYPALKPNTTYYYTVLNVQNGVNSCHTTTCNLRVQLIKPKGL